MSVIFLQQDIEELFKNKYVLIMGGSIQRSVYKDMLRLLHGNRYLTDLDLKMKGEVIFWNDKLVEGGHRSDAASNGVGYREVREYITDHHFLQFVFLSRCFNAYVASILKKLSMGDPKPDVIIVNSCLWDITRYGDNAVKDYKVNLEKLFAALEELLPDCLVIWNTNPPVDPGTKTGVLTPESELLKASLELEILEANYASSKLAKTYGHDVLDIHYFLRHEVHRRMEDGIHWDMTGHRRITNLLLSHIAEAWNSPMPNHLEKCSVNETDITELDEDESANLSNITATLFQDTFNDTVEYSPPPSTPKMFKSHRERRLFSILRQNAQRKDNIFVERTIQLSNFKGETIHPTKGAGGTVASTASIGGTLPFSNFKGGPVHPAKPTGVKTERSIPPNFSSTTSRGSRFKATVSQNNYVYNGCHSNQMLHHCDNTQAGQYPSWSLEAQMNRYERDGYSGGNPYYKYGAGSNCQMWEPYQERGYNRGPIKVSQNLHYRYDPYGRACHW